MTEPRAGIDASLFQALIESCADVFTLLDASGIFRYVSPSAAQVLGYTPEERIGRSGLDLVHDDDRKTVVNAFSHVIGSPGAPVRYTCRVRHKDGSWRYVESTVVNRLDGPLRAIVLNYRDVTRQRIAEDRLRASEERYRSLIHGALYGIYRTTVEGHVLDANPAFARMLGYDSPDELRVINMRDIYATPEDRQRIIDEARASGTRAIAVSIDWKRKEGTHITAHVAARAVEIDGVDCFEGIVEDVTAKRARDEEVRQAQKMEAVGRLARGIAHDFNNVLAAILGNADLLQLRIKHGDAMKADLDEITSAAERGASLTRQLLAFSSPGQGVVPEVLDLQDVVSSFDHMLKRLSGDIELELRTPAPAPKVRMVPGQIEQMMMNLVLNAREAVRDGGRIEVQADEVTLDGAALTRFHGLSAGRYARLLVRDNGAGISPDNQEHVFDPFFSTKDPAKGAGLGLAIVYSIAKDAGGSVGFTSTLGEGTTFEVLLPTA